MSKPVVSNAAEERARKAAAVKAEAQRKREEAAERAAAAKAEAQRKREEAAEKTAAKAAAAKAEAQRKLEEAAAKAAAVKAEAQRKREEAANAAAERAAAAKAEAQRKREEAEAKRQAAAEAAKQRTLEAQRKRDEAAAKRAAAAKSSQAEKKIAKAPSGATISLFGFGANKDEAAVTRPVRPAAKNSSPPGVPKMAKWRKNRDGSVTGFISGSRNFDEGEKITTSPIVKGDIANGSLVQTGSGSKYFLV